MSAAPATRNTLTAGPLLPFDPNPSGRLPFSATRNALSATPSWIPTRPAMPPFSAGPSTITTPDMTVSPGNVKMPGLSVSPGRVTTPTMSVSPGQVTTPSMSVGRVGLTTPPTILMPDGRQAPRSLLQSLRIQQNTIDVREDLELFFGGN
ncbi:MAG TPA: hypothetical protein VGE72_02095 [Azospirillum sp.]